MSDYRMTTGEAPPLPKRERTRRKRRALAVAVLTLAAAVAAATLLRVDRYVPAGGYVTTEDYAEVRPAVLGAVAEIHARSGDVVAAGDVLVQLADSEERATRDEARSTLQRAEAELARGEALLAEDRRARDNAIAMARLRLEHADTQLQLTRDLRDRGLAAGRALDDAQLREKLARAELDALLARDAALDERELDVLRRELEARREGLARADARLAQRRVLAPIAGRVQRYSFVTGELVRPETVLYEVFGGERKILKLRIAEQHALLVAAGQPYRARLLSYKGRHRVWFTGRVETLREVIEVENQKTYRVVTCTFEPGDLAVPPGTTADARILVGRVPLWVVLLGLY